MAKSNTNTISYLEECIKFFRSKGSPENTLVLDSHLFLRNSGWYAITALKISGQISHDHHRKITFYSHRMRNCFIICYSSTQIHHADLTYLVCPSFFKSLGSCTSANLKNSRDSSASFKNSFARSVSSANAPVNKNHN